MHRLCSAAVKTMLSSCNSTSQSKVNKLNIVMVIKQICIFHQCMSSSLHCIPVTPQRQQLSQRAFLLLPRLILVILQIDATTSPVTFNGRSMTFSEKILRPNCATNTNGGLKFRGQVQLGRTTGLLCSRTVEFVDWNYGPFNLKSGNIRIHFGL